MDSRFSKRTSTTRIVTKSATTRVQPSKPRPIIHAIVEALGVDPSRARDLGSVRMVAVVATARVVGKLLLAGRRLDLDGGVSQVETLFEHSCRSAKNLLLCRPRVKNDVHGEAVLAAGQRPGVQVVDRLHTTARSRGSRRDRGP